MVAVLQAGGPGDGGFADVTDRAAAHERWSRGRRALDALPTDQRLLLRARFGELPAAALALIENADIIAIKRWGERVLDAKILEEVLDEPS